MARFNPFRKKSLNITPEQPVKNGNSWFYPMYGTGAIRTIRDTATPDGQRTAYQFCPVVTSIVTKKVSAAANGVPYVKNAKDETVTDVRAKRLLDVIAMIDLDKAYTMNQVFGRAYIWKRRATGFNNITSLAVLNGWSIADEAAKPYIRYKEENSQVITTIPKSELLIWNDKYMNFAEDGTPMEGGSRLISLKDPVSNIAAVYEGLNMIWTAGGAVGMVSPMTDRMGAIPLTPDQQTEVNQHYSRSYGLNRGKSAVLVSQNPLRWQSTILPVDQLQYIPGLFENIRQVCDVYGVSTMLLGFTNGTTFTNKSEAEKAMYQDSVIPEVDGLCRTISNDPDFKLAGLTLAMDFSTVGSLQTDEKTKSDNLKSIYDTFSPLYKDGLITKNQLFEELGIEKTEDGDKFIAEIENQPPAVRFGVGGTQALQSILTDDILTPEQKSNILQVLFNISQEDANRMLSTKS